jgi:hypothetical protein
VLHVAPTTSSKRPSVKRRATLPILILRPTGSQSSTRYPRPAGLGPPARRGTGFRKAASRSLGLSLGVVPFDVIAAGGSTVVGQVLVGLRGLARRALQMTPDPLVEIYLPNLPPYQGENAPLQWLHAAARNVGQRNAKRVGGTDQALGAIVKVWLETDKRWRQVQWQGWKDERNLLVDEEYPIVHTTREFSPAITLLARTIPYRVRLMVRYGRGTSPFADFELTVPSDPHENMTLKAVASG